MRIHLETRRLKNRLVEIINASGLPTMCVRVVVEDLAQQLREQEARAVQMEARAEEEERRALESEKETDTQKEVTPDV